MKIDNKGNHDKVIKDFEKKFSAKERRKRKKMRVSGSGVKKLKSLISNK